MRRSGLCRHAAELQCRGSPDPHGGLPNGIDDDGLVDCEEPPCIPHTVCGGVRYEICNSGVDDDEDGRGDGSDPDCTRSMNCMLADHVPFDGWP